MAAVVKTRLGLAVGATVLAGLLLLTPAARAADPHCGDTIHHDVTLHHNLNCSGDNADALTIDRDGVTLNLNGHTITGPGGAAGTYSGVYSTQDDVTIKNGTIKSFYYDVYVYGGARNVVTRLTLLLDGSLAYDGLYTEYATGSVFSHNVAKNADEAFSVEYGSRNTVDRNKAVKSEYGIDVENETSTKVTNNTSRGISGTTSGLYDYENFKVTWMNNVANGGDYGVYSEYPTKVRFVKGTTNGNSSDGVYIHYNDPSSAYSATVSKSRANNNEVGMDAEYHVGGRGNTALGNDSYDCSMVRCNG